VALAGCNATELVSERAFEEKIERLPVGQTNRAEIEALFSSAQVVHRDRLTYCFADTEFGIGIRRYTPPSGPLLIAAGVFHNDTRCVITIGFNDIAPIVPQPTALKPST
jgi:hypothetical protein